MPYQTNGRLGISNFVLSILIAMAGFTKSINGYAEDIPVAPDAAAITPDMSPEKWSLHAQYTNLNQWHPAFHNGAAGCDPSQFNCMTAGAQREQTNDITLFFGVRLWQGAELYINPEVDEGFGIGNAHGIAGFTSGESYKVGKAYPYTRLQRAFLRQTINLGGKEQAIEADANQLGGSKTADNVVLTIGKFSLVDIFDTNAYAHDPKSDFMNWSIVDAGAFDYAGDAWGYVYGAAVEWTQSWWAARGAISNLSLTPGNTNLDNSGTQLSFVGEFEGRYQWQGHDGKIKLIGFDDHGKMANYMDAVRFAQGTPDTPDVANVRRMTSKLGLAINLEQALASDLGMFARASINDGRKETWDFTDINQSISVGLSMNGDRWGRHDDTVGLAAVVNGLSSEARSYFKAGGLGVLIGDGPHPNYGTERILETYYSYHVNKYMNISLDYQYVDNPAYNPDRGPISVFGFRLHAEM